MNNISPGGTVGAFLLIIAGEAGRAGRTREENNYIRRSYTILYVYALLNITQHDPNKKIFPAECLGADCYYWFGLFFI
jgi:hypothetical protein